MLFDLPFDGLPKDTQELVLRYDQLKGEYKDVYYELLANLDHHHLLPSDPWIALVEFVIDGERVVRLDLKETLVYAFRQPGQAKATPKPLPILARGPTRGPTSPESED